MMREYLRRGYRAAIPLLYGRSQFKLLLGSLSGLELRLHHLASSADLFSNAVSPIPIQAPFGDSMLIVAPHQDDETIGCGGALALQVRSGRAAHIIVLQDGADGYAGLGMTREAMAEMRNQESRRAAAVLGLPSPRFLNHPHLAVEAPKAVEELAAMIAAVHADVVFIPFLLDGHPDHRTANYILAHALKTVRWNVRVLGYEVWGLAIPNVLVIIDEVIEQKLKMLNCFEFANQAVDYVHTTKGLNMYRSRLLGAGVCRYAECFFEMPRVEYIELVERIHGAELGEHKES
ncbi:MAG TPA: PIG-L deacetylase family protein [Bryobacteraceae bacterium]|jgi:LmbE family N-acetylglucosaminyl deacetylase